MAAAADDSGPSSTSKNVFPETWTDEVPDTETKPLRYPGRKEWTKLQDVTVFAYRLDRRERLLNFYRFRGGVPDEWANENLRYNFKHTGKESTKFNRFEPQKLDFERLANRFARPIRKTSGKSRDGQRRFNTDVRVCYCWDDRHVFLVQAYFTFGQRTVEPGNVHLYRTTKAPILFYRLPTDTEIPLQTGRFHERDDVVYERFVLQPWSTYAVEEGTTYMILTLQKTLFSLHVFVGGGVSHRDDWRNPEEHRKLVLREEMEAKPQLHDLVEKKKNKKRLRDDDDDDDDDTFSLPRAKRNSTDPVPSARNDLRQQPPSSPVLETLSSARNDSVQQPTFSSSPPVQQPTSSSPPVLETSSSARNDLVQQAFKQCDLTFDDVTLLPPSAPLVQNSSSSSSVFLQELAQIPYLDNSSTISEEMLTAQIEHLQRQLFQMRYKRM